MTRDFQYLVAMVDPDSIGMKRIWRMMKLEWAQLKAHSNRVGAEAGLQLCFRFYNTGRPVRTGRAGPQQKYRTGTRCHQMKGQKKGRIGHQAG